MHVFLNEEVKLLHEISTHFIDQLFNVIDSVLVIE
jgi:hypothetical protein